MKPVQASASTKTSHILERIERFGTILANSDEFPHRLHLLVPPAQVTFPNGFPHKFRDGRLPASRASMKGRPEVIVKVKLRAPHDVYYTSSSVRPADEEEWPTAWALWIPDLTVVGSTSTTHRPRSTRTGVRFVNARE